MRYNSRMIMPGVLSQRFAVEEKALSQDPDPKGCGVFRFRSAVTVVV